MLNKLYIFLPLLLIFAGCKDGVIETPPELNTTSSISLISSSSSSVSSTSTIIPYINSSSSIEQSRPSSSSSASSLGTSTIDNIPPHITLLGNNPLLIIQGSDFVDPGATAYDGKDGNVSVYSDANISTTTLQEYIITYSASDNSNNKATATRVVKIVLAEDIEAPFITILGNNPLILDINESYVEYGANVVDNVDTNLSVSISGEVNSSQEGNYSIVYSVIDSNNNESNATRKVIVQGTNHMPIVTNVVINNTPRVDNSIEVSYTYFDEDSDAEGNSLIVFSTQSTQLQSSTSKTLALTKALEREYISVSITPIDDKGLQGVSVESNTSVKVLSQYEEQVTLPKCDANNTQVLFITQEADWSKINDANKSIFCVKAGDYMAGGVKVLTQSGTANAKRYIILDNNNNTHPGLLNDNELAKVGFIIDNANYWVIDRMAFTESLDTTNPILVKNSDNNIINRYFMNNVGNGIYIYPDSDNNTVQNCRIQRDKFDLNYDRAAIGLNSNSNLNENVTINIKNNKILNNEVYNFVDGFQAIRSGWLDNNGTILLTINVNYEGTIVDNNHFYIDSTIYTDCNGTHDSAGKCAYAENGIDIKAGSSNVNNPMIISNNTIWGYRKSDTNNSSLSDPGVGVVVHYNVTNVEMKNNIIFDSAVGINILDPSSLVAAAQNFHVDNTILYNIIGHGIYIADTNDTTVENSLFQNFINQDADVYSSIYWLLSYRNNRLDVNSNIISNADDRKARIADTNDSTYTNNTLFDAIGGDLNATAYTIEATDPTLGYQDLVFKTDTYTNTPREIRLERVLKP